VIMRLPSKLLLVALGIVIILASMPVLGQTFPDFAMFFHPSLSQSSEQIFNSSSTNFAQTNEMNVFAYPLINLGSTASFPALTSIAVPVTYGFPVLAHSGSSTAFNQQAATAIDMETFDFSFVPAPALSRVYVANNGDDTISVIDPATNTVLETIPGGGGPLNMVLAPDKKRLYVDHCCGRDYVWVFDTKTNELVANITLPSRYELNGIAIDPSGTRLYVVGFIPYTSQNSVFVIDTTTYNIVATITVASPPVQIAVNPAGTRAYVTLGGGTMSSAIMVAVIDTATNNVIDNVPVGIGPYGVAISPNSARVYVTNRGRDPVPARFTVIDAATDSIIAALALGNTPGNIAVTPDGARAYVTNGGDLIQGYVSVIDTAAVSEIARIPVGSAPYGIAVSSDGSRLYVTNNGDNTASVIDTASNSVIATIPVGNSPMGIAVT
jgi:YVTN family beta-propeller protein